MLFTFAGSIANVAIGIADDVPIRVFKVRLGRRFPADEVAAACRGEARHEVIFPRLGAMSMPRARRSAKPSDQVELPWLVDLKRVFRLHHVDRDFAAQSRAEPPEHARPEDVDRTVLDHVQRSILTSRPRYRIIVEGPRALRA